jgi:hypothetical protein
MNVDLVKRLFAGIHPAPLILDIGPTDDKTSVITIGPFTLTDQATEVKVGPEQKPVTVHNYILDVGVTSHSTRDDEGGVDVVELESGPDFAAVIVKAVEQYAGWQARNVLDDLAVDAYAAELDNDRQLLAQAYAEGVEAGRHDVNTYTEDMGHDPITNPYPYGIQHYDEWKRGYQRGQIMAAF